MDDDTYYGAKTMIKRDGVQLMNARTNNVSIAKETLEVCKQGQYLSPTGNTINISDALNAAINGTILYQDIIDHNDFPLVKPTIEVVNETTADAAMRLMAAGKTDIVALNFASARNQGGGFLSGAIAQEEDLCRASGLYQCLTRKPVFYNENILCDDCYYTDNVIYSPKVPFFRDHDNQFLEQPFELSIISAPAPCLIGVKHVDESLLIMTLANRAEKILAIAHENGHKNIILGAWGCGAFQNDPNMVANVFAAALKFVPVFEYVCFAVYDTRTPPSVYQTFRDVFVGEERMFPRQ